MTDCAHPRGTNRVSGRVEKPVEDVKESPIATYSWYRGSTSVADADSAVGTASRVAPIRAVAVAGAEYGGAHRTRLARESTVV